MTHPLRARLRRTCAHAAFSQLALALVLSSICPVGKTIHAREVSKQRITPVVLAVRQGRAAVVSIQGEKINAGKTDAADRGDSKRPVNGMGTGTIIDERGYILTNQHVIADVRSIEVTLDDGRKYTAESIAHDEAADLAVIKIPTTQPLPTIRFGTSADLMEGESVIALGNAYGYEQTVTRGIISALGRDVEVGEQQKYKDLIQTDASINPGNSGGPLLNIDGEMIGVNVAVRAGAQGIGFAIPIDDALVVASRLLNVARLRNNWHGLVTQVGAEPEGSVKVTNVEFASPAQQLGLQPGDEIVRVGAMHVVRPLDLERAFLDLPAGTPVPVEVRRGAQTLVLDLTLGVWDVLGLKLTEEPRNTFEQRNQRFRGGMYVAEVRPNSPAATEGVRPGDILVGMHKWETASAEDVQYIMSRPDLNDMGTLKFYVLRGETILYGHLDVASKLETPAAIKMVR